MSTGAPSRVLTSLGRQALRHRRLLSAGLFAGAVACALAVLAPPSAPTVSVVVATRPLDAGVQLRPTDLRTVHRPVGSTPGALTSSDTAVGRVLAGTVGAGEALTAGRLVGPALASGLGARGHVAAPVRLADPDVAALLHAGDLVDVILASGAESKVVAASVVAPSARVVAVVNAGSDDALGTTSSPTDGALVVLDVPRSQALDLARAAAVGPLSVLLVG